jgi:hypothetical protein
MAIAVIGGLVVSTALSLLVVPAFFVAADGASVRARAWLERTRARLARPRPGRLPAPPRAEPAAGAEPPASPLR